MPDVVAIKDVRGGRCSWVFPATMRRVRDVPPMLTHRFRGEYFKQSRHLYRPTARVRGKYSLHVNEMHRSYRMLIFCFTPSHVYARRHHFSDGHIPDLITPKTTPCGIADRITITGCHHCRRRQMGQMEVGICGATLDSTRDLPLISFHPSI